MISYPTQFPCVSRIEGHSADLSAGLVRTPMGAGNSRQRRAYRHVPHLISLVFVIEQGRYSEWLAWVNAFAWDEFFTLNLPGLLASEAGTNTAPVPVRFCSDLATDLLPVNRLWYWRVRVQAEFQPNVTDFPLISDTWVIGGTPSAPSLDWVIGGTPASPSPIFTNPGTPASPTVYV